MSAGFVIEGVPDVKYEDSGCALILEVSAEDRKEFVRIQSYDDGSLRGGEIQHEVVEPLVGRRLRVTVEVLS